MLTFCGNCGHLVSTKGLKCPGCGNPAPQRRLCTKCGTEMLANALACSICGIASYSLRGPPEPNRVGGRPNSAVYVAAADSNAHNSLSIPNDRSMDTPVVFDTGGRPLSVEKAFRKAGLIQDKEYLSDFRVLIRLGLAAVISLLLTILLTYEVSAIPWTKLWTELCQSSFGTKSSLGSVCFMIVWYCWRINYLIFVVGLPFALTHLFTKNTTNINEVLRRGYLLAIIQWIMLPGFVAVGGVVEGDLAPTGSAFGGAMTRLDATGLALIVLVICTIGYLVSRSGARCPSINHTHSSVSVAPKLSGSYRYSSTFNTLAGTLVIGLLACSIYRYDVGQATDEINMRTETDNTTRVAEEQQCVNRFTQIADEIASQYDQGIPASQVGEQLDANYEGELRDLENLQEKEVRGLEPDKPYVFSELYDANLYSHGFEVNLLTEIYKQSDREQVQNVIVDECHQSHALLQYGYDGP